LRNFANLAFNCTLTTVSEIKAEGQHGPADYENRDRVLTSRFPAWNCSEERKHTRQTKAEQDQQRRQGATKEGGH